MSQKVAKRSQSEEEEESGSEENTSGDSSEEEAVQKTLPKKLLLGQVDKISPPIKLASKEGETKKLLERIEQKNESDPKADADKTSLLKNSDPETIVKSPTKNNETLSNGNIFEEKKIKGKEEASAEFTLGNARNDKDGSNETKNVKESKAEEMKESGENKLSISAAPKVKKVKKKSESDNNSSSLEKDSEDSVVKKKKSKKKKTSEAEEDNASVSSSNEKKIIKEIKKARDGVSREDAEGQEKKKVKKKKESDSDVSEGKGEKKKSKKKESKENQEENELGKQENESTKPGKTKDLEVKKKIKLKIKKPEFQSDILTEKLVEKKPMEKENIENFLEGVKKDASASVSKPELEIRKVVNDKLEKESLKKENERDFDKEASKSFEAEKVESSKMSEPEQKNKLAINDKESFVKGESKERKEDLLLGESKKGVLLKGEPAKGKEFEVSKKEEIASKKEEQQEEKERNLVKEDDAFGKKESDKVEVMENDKYETDSFKDRSLKNYDDLKKFNVLEREVKKVKEDIRKDESKKDEIKKNNIKNDEGDIRKEAKKKDDSGTGGLNKIDIKDDYSKGETMQKEDVEKDLIKKNDLKENRIEDLIKEDNIKKGVEKDLIKKNDLKEKRIEDLIKEDNIKEGVEKDLIKKNALKENRIEDLLKEDNIKEGVEEKLTRKEDIMEDVNLKIDFLSKKDANPKPKEDTASNEGNPIKNDEINKEKKEIEKIEDKDLKMRALKRTNEMLGKLRSEFEGRNEPNEKITMIEKQGVDGLEDMEKGENFVKITGIEDKTENEKIEKEALDQVDLGKDKSLPKRCLVNGEEGARKKESFSNETRFPLAEEKAEEESNTLKTEQVEDSSKFIIKETSSSQLDLKDDSKNFHDNLDEWMKSILAKHKINSDFLYGETTGQTESEKESKLKESDVHEQKDRVLTEDLEERIVDKSLSDSKKKEIKDSKEDKKKRQKNEEKSVKENQILNDENLKAKTFKGKDYENSDDEVEALSRYLAKRYDKDEPQKSRTNREDNYSMLSKKGRTRHLIGYNEEEFEGEADQSKLRRKQKETSGEENEDTEEGFMARFRREKQSRAPSSKDFQYKPKRRDDTEDRVKEKTRHVKALIEKQKSVIENFKTASKKLNELENMLKESKVEVLEQRSQMENLEDILDAAYKQYENEVSVAVKQLKQQKKPKFDDIREEINHILNDVKSYTKTSNSSKFASSAGKNMYNGGKNVYDNDESGASSWGRFFDKIEGASKYKERFNGNSEEDPVSTKSRRVSFEDHSGVINEMVNGDKNYFGKNQTEERQLEKEKSTSSTDDFINKIRNKYSIPTSESTRKSNGKFSSFFTSYNTPSNRNSLSDFSILESKYRRSITDSTDSSVSMNKYKPTRNTDDSNLIAKYTNASKNRYDGLSSYNPRSYLPSTSSYSTHKPSSYSYLAKTSSQPVYQSKFLRAAQTYM